MCFQGHETFVCISSFTPQADHIWRTCAVTVTKHQDMILESSDYRQIQPREDVDSLRISSSLPQSTSLEYDLVLICLPLFDCYYVSLGVVLVGLTN